MKPRLWQMKALAVSLLSRLPAAEQLHFQAQRLLGRHRLDAPEMTRRARDLFLLLSHTGRSVQGARVLEVGTGWFPFVPLLAALAGAREVVTVDIHPWLTLRYARAALYALSPFLGAHADAVRQDGDIIRKRYARALQETQHATDLASFFAPLGVMYRCPCDVTAGDPPEGAFDILMSSNVLEHLPPETLRSLHGSAARLLRPGGVAVHRFNPGDHYHKLTGSHTNFLQYDERQWHWLGGSGLAYHNRLRSHEHVAAAQGKGLAVAFWADRLDERELDRVRHQRAEFAAPFAFMPVEFLGADYTWLVLENDPKAESATRPIHIKSMDEVIRKDAPSGIGRRTTVAKPCGS